MKKIKIKAAHSDKRGAITDLIERETINAVTLITFAKGAVRANHYHKKTWQWNYVMSGRIQIAAKKGKGPRKSVVMKAGDLTVTVPNESHALKALTPAVLMVFTKGPRGGKEYETDTFRLTTPLLK
jgi:quercetin dioxygenase-like cupin family protein